MEVLVFISSWLIVFGFILSLTSAFRSIYNHHSPHKFLRYLLFSLFISIAFAISFAWWADLSNELLLSYYGYDADGMNESEFFRNVKKENLQAVQELITSQQGIGWPLKALLTVMPIYLFSQLVYLVNRVWRRRNTNNSKYAK